MRSAIPGLPDWLIVAMAAILLVGWLTGPSGSNDHAAWALGVLTLPATGAAINLSFRLTRQAKRRVAHRRALHELRTEQEEHA